MQGWGNSLKLDDIKSWQLGNCEMNQIPNDKMATLYGNMMHKLSKRYSRGFYMWISIFYKGLDKQLTDADNKINAAWERCIEGKASLMEFIGALNLYEECMLKGYKLYKNRRKP